MLMFITQDDTVHRQAYRLSRYQFMSQGRS